MRILFQIGTSDAGVGARFICAQQSLTSSHPSSKAQSIINLTFSQTEPQRLEADIYLVAL